MLVNMPLDSNDQNKFDHLAYGIAVTGTQITNFLSNVHNKNEKVVPTGRSSNFLVEDLSSIFMCHARLAPASR